MSRLEYYPNSLIIVPGHALFQPWVTQTPEDSCDDKYWFLQPFQAGEPRKYVEHIQEGIEILATSPGNSLLMFSGGRTREEVGAWSEASTYFAIAEQMVKRHGLAHLIGAMTIEEYARDSLENIAFSRANFRHLFGYYPLKTTVVGWRFKSERYARHAATLDIADSFVYIGRNYPEDLQGALDGESVALEAFRDFPFGTAGILKAKRDRRTFGSSTPPYAKYLPPELANEYAMAGS